MARRSSIILYFLSFALAVPALKDAIDMGVSYGTKWQELYELDIVNLGSSNKDPGIPNGYPSDVIAYGHAQLYHP